MQERWQMNKLGFVNFWLYDWEEFPFSEGRLLLRGENGAGKSVTTQSFIPFMLDGDLRPYRLDSFGSKDRKMAYYLLGDQKEESTGYLYLEFCKPQQRLYRTLVVGLRAKRSSSNIEFWGFCLSDGRRVGPGPEDFALFETKGSQHISLTRQEVHNRFGSGENWVERGSDYKQMVNRMLFGCAETEQYDRLLRLLIQLRKPKLSKDFSPRLVQDILNSSLQPLSEDDIAPMVNSMEKMDSIQAQLESLQQSLQAARLLRNEYTRYNQYMLGKKGEYYLKARQSTNELQSVVQGKESGIAQARDALSQAQEEYQTAQQQEGEFSRQLEALEASDTLENAVQRQQELRALASQQQQDVESEKNQEAKKQEALNAKERELAQAHRCTAEKQEQLEQGFAELEALNRELLYPGHPVSIRDLDYNAQKSALDLYAGRLRTASSLLRHCQDEAAVMDSYLQKQNAALAELRHEQNQLETAQRTVGAERDALSGAFAQLEDARLAFHLESRDVSALLAQVDIYEGVAQDQAIQAILRSALDRLLLPRQQEASRLQQSLAARQQELNELGEQRSALLNQKEMPPQRSLAVQQTRAFLQQQGVPHASFYELVDFEDSLPAERRALLEAQLADAGILDALILPEGFMDRFPELLAEHPDHFLRPESFTPTSSPLPLRPENSCPDWADVTGILARLSQQEEGTVWFASDGRYQQGVVLGFSVPQQPASYIGASARREHRERQIAALSLQIEVKQREISEIQTQLRQAEQEQKRLLQEYTQCPNTAELAEALHLAAEQQAKVELKDRLYQDCQTQVRRQQEKLDSLRAKLLNLTRGLPFEPDAETYENLEGCCASYQQLFQSLNGEKQTLEVQQGRENDLEQLLNGLNDDLLACTDRLRRRQAEHRKTLAALEELQQYLDQPETRALVRRIQELKQGLEDARKRATEADKHIFAQQKELNYLLPDLAEKKQQLEKAIVREEHLRQIFEEELCHGPGQPGLRNEPLWQQAESARNGIRQNDRNLAPEKLRASLEKNLRDASALNAYRIALNPLFESEEGILRGRDVVDLYPDGQRIDLLDFIRRLENRIEADRQLLSQEDRRLFETILNQTVTTKLSHRINNSQDWTRRMSAIMERLNTSMGLRFSLTWKGKPADQQEELGTSELIELLRKDPAVMGDADRNSIIQHFHAKITKARELSQAEAAPATYSELMRQALDFRNWFTFHLYYQKGGPADGEGDKRPRKELTDSAFNSFSGGEKAMAMYVPLFAALSAQYEAASEDAPRIMALDEAFAGVDETNIDSMFALVHQLGLNYIMNSQALWGCYPSVSSLNISELWRPQDADVVTILRYHWDGRVLQMEDA